MMQKMLRLCAFVSLMVCSGTLSAHNLGEGYVYLTVTDATLSGRLELTLGDISKIVPLGNPPGERPTETQFNANQDRVLDYLGKNLAFIVDGARHSPVFGEHDFVHLDLASFVRIDFTLPAVTNPPDEIEVFYNILFNDAEKTHRGQVLIERNEAAGIESNEAQFSAIFGPGRETQTVRLDKIPAFNVFRNFVRHGAWHIWIGLDHVLFLCALLLPAVMVRKGGEWLPVVTFRESFIYVVKVVTLFTVAHTITLSLASLGIVQLPEQLVEGVIALSIAVVALNVLWPFLNHNVWIVVFVFGLFHGLGFASVLEPLGVSGGSKTAALLGFNVGVELGQLAIILVVFPLLFVLRNWGGYRPLILKGGSIALILVSSFWFVERTIDVPFISAKTFGLASLGSPATCRDCNGTDTET
jgi:hypothetical protein